MPYIITAILFSITLLFDPSVYLPYYTPKIFFLILSLFWVFFCFFIHQWFILKSHLFKFSVLEVLLVLLFVWRIITNYSIISKHLIILFLISQLFIVFVLRQYSHRSKLKPVFVLLFSLYTIGIIESAYGLFQYFSFPVNAVQSIKTPIIGTIGLPNAFGSFMTISVIAALFLALASKRYFLKAIYILSTALFTVVLILNGSRGALLALMISLFVFGFIWSYNKLNRFRDLLQLKWFRYVSTGLILSFLILITVFLYNKDIESSSGRLMIWQISLPMFTENPVSGIGYGNYSLEYLNYQARFFQNPSNQDLIHKATNLKQAHNEYLEVFCETGLIGCGLFLLLLTLSLMYIFKSLVKPVDNRHFYFNLALLFIFLIILLHGFVDDTLHFFPTNILFFMIIGFLPAPTVNLTVKPFKTVYKLFLILLIFVLNIYISAFLFNQYQGYRFWAGGQQRVTANRAILAIPFFEKAIQKLPSNGELLFHYGSALTLTGKYDKGLHYLDKSLNNFNDRNIYLSKSYAYLKLYDLAKAEYQAKIALSMFPTHLAPHLLLGRIYYKMNDIKRSKESLLKCINMDTKIKSQTVSQIQQDAQRLWWNYYGR